MNLTLTVTPAAIRNSTDGYTDAQIDACIDAAWEALDIDDLIADLDVSLDYATDYANVTGGTGFAVHGFDDADGARVADEIRERFSHALDKALAAVGK